VNLSGDPAQEYFADGMTEALSTELGKLGALRVISRTSMMHYKGSTKPVPEIARELNVDAVVEGAVWRSGNQVRIETKLIHAAPERQLWAESYERDLLDTLVLQRDVARAIAREVHVRVSPQGQTRMTSGRRLVNPDAYDAYLKGRYEASKWTAEGWRKSIEYFEQSIQKDPTYAEAWAGLASVYGFNADRLKAKQAALKALELDETVPDAHTALALVSHWEWAWADAKKQLQRAIILDPNNAEAHQFYGYHFMIMGRYDQAVPEMKRATELDPFEGNKRNSLGVALFFAGRYDDALEQFRQTPDRTQILNATIV
jgi:TolB-like protein/Tfp pilus assembly protein PilF